MITIYTPTKNRAEAKKIATVLLKKKLIACANIFPIESIYWWNNKITNDKEIALFLKTNKPFKTIEKEIKKLHSYDIPCIEKINVQFNKEYRKWVRESTTIKK